MSDDLSYFEKYLETLRGLPGEIQRNFNMLHDLDKKVHDVTKDVDKRQDDYLRKSRGISRRERLQAFRTIKDQLKLGRSLADQKVQLAVQTYDMIDRHIRQLDSDLARFESEIKQTLHKNALTQRKSEITEAESQAGRRRKKATNCRASGSSGQMDDAMGHSVRITNTMDTSTSSTVGGIPASASLVLALTNNPSEVLDMPVDPNEPTYCICHQVSYGEMVGCDNPECLIEWFHFGCVGLVETPKGKWYCPKCIDDRQRNKL